MDISNWIERWADFSPDRVAIRFEGHDLTYRTFRDRVRATACMLSTEFAVGHGDRVAFLGFNSPDMLALLFACGRIGAILVPLNWRLAAPEHIFILRHSGAAALFVEPEFAPSVEKLRNEIGACRVVPMVGEGGFEPLLARSAGRCSEPVGRADDPVLIVYTSGTTGRPKGAVLTQNALAFNAVNSIAAHDMTSADVVLTNLPMFHVGGLNIHTTPALHAGATVVLERRFEPDAMIAAIRAERPTLMILVPALMQALRDHPAWPTIDFTSLRCINTGSTTVPSRLLRTYLERGIPVVQIYGSTETAPVIIHQRIPDAFRNPGSTGKPALHCAAKICNSEGHSVQPGERGEIVVRGPNVMAGYWQDPEATAAVLKDGWFWTGDAGHTDADGNFYVDDRIKDVIISGSENIYPAEVELVLDECPEIAEAAVVAREDTRWGEVPVACVVRRPGAAITRERVLALYDGRLARYKHPHDVVFMDKLPRNVMGKVLKFELRDLVRRG